MVAARKLVVFLFLLVAGGVVYQHNLDWLQENFSKQHTVAEDIGESDYDIGNEEAVWWGEKSHSFKIDDSRVLADAKVLGSTNEEKRIEVDLTNQKLYAFEGDKKIYEFPISSGLYDWTPRGIFRVWIKLRSTKMEGGNKALGTYYNLPNVPYVMYFSNNEVPAWKGYGIHGAYWHNDFGRPKSHGCVNVSPENAGVLYYWAEPNLNDKTSIKATADNPGIKILIYGKYQG